MKPIKFSKPIKKDGKEIKAVALDFSKITGRQIIAAESEARLLGDTAADLQFSKTFQAILATKAADENLIVDDVLNLPGPDFLQITNSVSNFLFGWVLESRPQK